MARKPAKMYRKLKRPYTRREYMGGVPGIKVVHFDMGNPTADFPVTLTLKAKEACQIRHTALESARIIANKTMMKAAGRLGYHLKLNVYPHQVLRENKQATGAGADRVSDGMRKAFGKPVGTAARVHPEQTIITLRVGKQHADIAKDALRKAGHKLPTPTRIETLVSTKPL
ncbi:MAG: 50S ribosomal protein L16 [Methermicoccaceae archaeon]